MRALLALLGMLGGGGAALAGPAIEIVADPVADGYAISVVVRADAPFVGRASINIDRRGLAGTARTNQGTSLDLPEGGERVVARSRLSFSEGDVLDATATLQSLDGTEIARDVLRLD